MLRKPEVSAGLMGHVARMQTLPFTYNRYKKIRPLAYFVFPVNVAVRQIANCYFVFFILFYFIF